MSINDFDRLPIVRPYQEIWPGLGVADMAVALRTGRPHRANGAMDFHVLETMHAFHTSSQSDRHVKLRSTCKRPPPLSGKLHEGDVE